ncbi:MAG TPA: DegT/DnrJ/EryC1/StrS aminotransferase family protein [Gammaproteobacteria bacterium]|nr:DegT/DnrJ/EryC1/StrS aminotransferase family protein [Gammaproteobacteria bacterium]
MQIPVYQPYFHGNEKLYVNECLDSTWISSKGKFITEFEEKFAQYIGAPYATSVCNGTVALHLALLALDIQPGDEIIVPTLTYVASVNTIVQTGAKPVFVDSLAETWQIDPEDARRKITPKTRAIMAVHLYGHPCDMQALMDICKEHHLFLIEDCAEAFGSYYRGQHVGTFGDIATFSFFGNKTLTTGEGGMVTMKDKNIHMRAAHLKNQGASQNLQYWHDQVGYNYRMTNICAAIGLAQLEKVDEVLAKKRQLAEWYRENLKNLPLATHEEIGDVHHSFWMCSILLNEAKERDLLRNHLNSTGIETRPLFYPTHLMSMYKKHKEKHPIAESLGSRGINLPSWPGLAREQVDKIISTIREYFA